MLFTTAVDIINTLAAAQSAGQLKREFHRYLKPAVLIIDELGYLPIDKHGADLLFQIISQRYERAPMVITTNRAYKHWSQRCTLLVPVSKSGRPRRIALNGAALALLRSLPRDPASPYVFPTQLRGLFYPWDRIRRRAGLSDVRLHDLRHNSESRIIPSAAVVSDKILGLSSGSLA